MRTVDAQTVRPSTNNIGDQGTIFTGSGRQHHHDPRAVPVQIAPKDPGLLSPQNPPSVPESRGGGMGHRGLTGHFGQPRAGSVKCYHNAAIAPSERGQSKRRELMLESAQIMPPERQILREIDRSGQKTPPRHLGVQFSTMAWLSRMKADRMRFNLDRTRSTDTFRSASQERPAAGRFKLERWIALSVIGSPIACPSRLITRYRGRRPRCSCAGPDQVQAYWQDRRAKPSRPEYRHRWR